MGGGVVADGEWGVMGKGDVQRCWRARGPRGGETEAGRWVEARDE
jgi:hypothetical protein